jgi:hypothetical protein
LKITVFWDVTLCSPVDHYQRFGEICAAGKQSILISLFLVLLFDPADGSSMFISNIDGYLLDYIRLSIPEDDASHSQS